MAQLLAPYNNSMRLGQGFNSYTQQICLDQAVLPDTSDNRARLAKSIVLSNKRPTTATAQPSEVTQPLKNGIQSIESNTGPVAENPQKEGHENSLEDPLANTQPTHDGDHTKEGVQDTQKLEVPPWVKPQIVTYSSRFVDKLSDVTDAMNISGSLSIKTATIGGKASGSYVDSDKFKSSDINFHLQVKVTNQIHNAKNYSIFNKISTVSPQEFPEVYGDSFISGWEEGGELDAIISIKVLDKSKIFQVKASIEAEMTTPSIAGEVKAKVDIDKSKLSKETETTISVNWSGGGSIKHPQEDWTIDSLKKAAAAFPDLVAITPQRTYAILTRYTALESFHRQRTNFKPLDYENAGIYTGALLDAYMDYKALWKQISNATYELESSRATINMGEPSEEIAKLARVREFPSGKTNSTTRQITEGSSTSSTVTEVRDQQQLAVLEEDNPISSDIKEVSVFPPSFAGLIQARKVCRFEMSKIVREVDLVANDPTLSTDPSRDSYFLHPLVFKQLLPVVRSLSPESAALGIRDPAATLLLGYSQPQSEDRALPPVYILTADLKGCANPLRKSIEKVAHKAHDYRMQGCVGPILEKDVHSLAEPFNDLEKLDQTYRLSAIAIWAKYDKVDGITMQYANGQKKLHGTCDGSPSHSLSLAFDGSEVIVEVVIKESVDDTGLSSIAALSVATCKCNVLDTSIPGDQSVQSSEAAGVTKPTEAPAQTTSGGPTTAGSSTTTKNDKPGNAVQAEEKNKPATDFKKSKNLKLKTITWLKPDDPRYSLRGFFGLTRNSLICTLGVVWGKDSFVPVPTARIQPSLCKGFLNLSQDLQNNIRGHLSFAGKFLMGTSVSTNYTGTTAKYFNALDVIDVHWQLKAIGFASEGGKLRGLKVWYANGREVVHGHYTEETKTWTCDVGLGLSIAKITAGRKQDEENPAYVDTVEFVRRKSEGELPAWPLEVSTLRFLGEADVRVSKDVSEVVETAPKIGNAEWSVRGFYGEHGDGLITRLGVIWGKC